MLGGLVINGMRGLGDNLFQRALLQGMVSGPDLYLDTPWPELYEDIGVRCTRAVTALRTQAKNVQRSQYQWYRAPRGSRVQKIGYGPHINTGRSIIEILQEQLARVGVVTEPVWRLPENLPRTVHAPRIAVVRPATVRAEWHNEARNPLPKYIAQAAGILQHEGYYVVSIADLADKQEWALEPLPPADLVLHKGELNVLQLLGLISSAHVVVGPVGWILPAAISAGTNICLIAGGHGAHNAPEIVTHKSMSLGHVGWIFPDEYCRCNQMRHQCNKTISDFPNKFTRWLHAQRPISVAA